MTKYRLEPGREYDFLTPDDMNQALSNFHGSVVDAVVREQLRGIRIVKRVQHIDVQNGAVNAGDIIGPNAGYVWDLRSINYSGFCTNTPSTRANVNFGVTVGSDLTSVSTATLYYGYGRQIMFVSGATTGGIQTFNKNLILSEDERIVAYGIVSTANLTATITVGFLFAEVPAEMVGKLFL